MSYRPKEASQMRTPFNLQVPKYEAYLGVSEKSWQTASGTILANFKGYGGTESINNGVLSIEDTATVVCFFRPDIQSDCRLVRLTDNAVFEIIGEPENIDQYGQYLKFKVRRVKGGA